MTDSRFDRCAFAPLRKARVSPESDTSMASKLTLAVIVCKRALVIATILCLVDNAAGRAQDLSGDTMTKLQYLGGQWSCTVSNEATHKLLERLAIDYSFSPDKLWMIERSHDAMDRAKDWALQIWGYDANSSRLVAIQFTKMGVFTKSVEGWHQGAFISKRNDNGATVTLTRPSPNSIRWVIESVDHSFVVDQDCIRH